jgi:hypothetical protein
MICFRDRSFCSKGDQCVTSNDRCGRKFTDEDKAAAAKWWEGMKGEPPVAFMDFSQSCGMYQPKEMTDDD